jgi:hypothetical protein
MPKFEAMSRASRVVVVLIAFAAAYAAGQAVGPSLVLRVLAGGLTFIVVCVLGILLVSKRS